MFKNSLSSLFKSRNLRRPRRNAWRLGISAMEVLEARQLMTVYAIDPINGADTNPGTLELPFQTPRNLSYSTSEGNANAIQLQAGDTVSLRDGIHDWSSLLNDVSNDPSYPGAAFLLLGVHGTEASPITVQAYPGERPIVTHLNASGLALKQNSVGRIAGRLNHLDCSGFTSNCPSKVRKMRNTSGSTFYAVNKFHNTEKTHINNT